MSLEWDITEIENYKEFQIPGEFDEAGAFTPDALGSSWQLRPDVECLMWLSLTCGYSRITDKNWREVYTRIAMVETITGAYRIDRGDGPTAITHHRYFEPQEVRRCIGLKTNAPSKAKAQFDKEIATLLRRSIEPQLKALQDSCS